MATTTYNFEPRLTELPYENFQDKYAVVVFEKSNGINRRITGRLVITEDGKKVTVYRTDGKFRTLHTFAIIRVVVLDYIPPV